MSLKTTPIDPRGLSSREEAVQRLCFGSSCHAALIFDLGKDGTPAPIRECNEAAQRLLGYTHQDLKQRTVLELAEGEGRQALAQSLLDLLMVEAGTWDASLRDAQGRELNLTVDGLAFTEAGKLATILLLRPVDDEAERQLRARAADLPACFSRQATAFLESRPGDDIYPQIAAGLAELVGNASVLITSCDERAGLLTVREVVGPVHHWVRFAQTLGLTPHAVKLPRGGPYLEMMHRGTVVHAQEGLFDMCLGEVPRVVCRTAEKMFGISHVYAMGICCQGVLHGTIVVLTRRDEPLEQPELVEAFGNLAAVALHRQQSMEALATSQSKLLRFERLQAMGRLASGLAHDFNNLLTLILGNSDLLERSLPDTDPRRRPVEKIISAARRAASLTTQLLAFSRQDPSEADHVEMDPILAELEPILQGLAGERCRLVLRLRSGPQDAHVMINPTQVEQIAMNLVSNACDAMPSGGEVVVQTRRVAVAEPQHVSTGVLPAGDYVTLSVNDTGVGMTSDTEHQVFEPFFTTKPKQKGTGLGLSTVYGIVEQSQGHIQIDTSPKQGTKLTVYLPHKAPLDTGWAPSVAAEPPDQLTPEPTTANGLTVLLVEDQDLVRDVAGMMLRELGYRVVVAAGGEEALEIDTAHQGSLELLVTDVVMPGMTGPELAEQLLSRRPDTRVLFISGFTDGASLRADVLPAPVAFLAKPFSRGELQRALDELRARD